MGHCGKSAELYVTVLEGQISDSMSLHPKESPAYGNGDLMCTVAIWGKVMRKRLQK